jgi:hypothetical protein
MIFLIMPLFMLIFKEDLHFGGKYFGLVGDFGAEPPPVLSLSLLKSVTVALFSTFPIFSSSI